VLVAVSAAVLATSGSDAEGLRVWIRATARLSVVLFLLVFVARPLRAVWSATASGWLLANRRYLGVAFAVSHGLHGIGLVWLSLSRPDIFEASTSTSTLVLGGIGYGFVAAMTATSFDRSARWLGPQRWKLLHATGLGVLWLVFLATFAGSAAGGDALNWLPTLTLLTALALRLAVRVRRRASARASGSAA
jgi:hypothetical protein